MITSPNTTPCEPSRRKKSMKKRAMTVALAAAAIAVAVPFAFAQTGVSGPGMTGGYGGYGTGPGVKYGYGPGYGVSLNLTDEQRSELRKIRRELRSKQWELMDRIHDECALRDEASADAAANEADDRIAALQHELFSKATTVPEQMDAVLTPKQRQQLRREGY